MVSVDVLSFAVATHTRFLSEQFFERASAGFLIFLVQQAEVLDRIVDQ